MTETPELRVATAADLHLVEPLWIAVHHRHIETMPELAPFVGDDTSWAFRKELYEELLAKPDTLLLLAFDGDAAIGYGLAHVMAVEDSWVPDTWQTDSRIGEVESLSVLPRYRGSGLGSVLLDRLEAHLRTCGVRDLILGVVPGNQDAIRLYERRGYRPTFLYLSRFEGRD
jgi:ribosomal protein S18 acetylase RimI-like enzyme